MINTDFYDQKWVEWDNMIKYSPAPRHRRRIMIKMVRRYSGTGLTLHDVGCGNSVLLLEIKRKMGHLHLSGSDISAAVIENNRKLYRDIQFYSFDIGKEILHSDRYDIITCSEVLEHVENLKTALKNFHRLLKSDGIVILTVPGGRIYPIDKLVGHYRHFSDTSLFNQMFEVKEFIKWGFPFFNLYKWAINLLPEKMLKGFNSDGYGIPKKLISNFIYFLFHFNLPLWGNQIVLVMKRRVGEHSSDVLEKECNSTPIN